MRCDFLQWHEDKSPLCQVGMGQSQFYRPAGHIRAVHEIDVYGTGSPFSVTYPAQRRFYRLAVPEKFHDRELRFHQRSRIDERRLVFLSPWRRFIKG